MLNVVHINCYQEIILQFFRRYRYWFSITQLLARARKEEAWPWTEEYIYRGDMERSFLRHLFEVDPHLNFDSKVKEKIIVLQVHITYIQIKKNPVCYG